AGREVWFPPWSGRAGLGIWNVPAELFDGGVVGVNRQIGDQLPVNPCPIGWLFTLLGMEHGQGEGRIALLLSDRRQDVNAAVSDFDSCHADMALGVANLNTVLPGDLHVLHLIGNRMVSILRQPVDTASDQKMSAQLLCYAEELVNVALPIADMDAPRRFAEQRRRLTHVFQPADALLLL